MTFIQGHSSLADSCLLHINEHDEQSELKLNLTFEPQKVIFGMACEGYENNLMGTVERSDRAQ